MLRSIIPLIALCFTASAYAQGAPPDEHHTTSGSRIWPPAGPVWAAEGPNPTPGHGCAEPNCGEAPNDPGSGGATTQNQKDQQNKQAKEKAKSAAGTILAAAKAAQDVIKGLKAWLSFHIVVHDDDMEVMIDANGNKTVKGRCQDLQIGMGSNDKPLPCTIIKGTPEQVRLVNGSLENQLRLTFEIYEACFYQKTCGPKYYSFIAGSEQELSRLLNEATGTTEF